ncbi:type II secretion system F family protein [Staphylococcus chromogenes]|nr:type II secretion system F family protein [Staphylococcus chromogenes]
MLVCLLLAMAVVVLPAKQPSQRIVSRAKNVPQWWPMLAVIPVALLLAKGIGLVLSAAIILGTLWYSWQAARRRKVQARTARATASIVGQLSSALEAGSSIAAAMQVVSAHLPTDTPSELAAVVAAAARRTAMGASGARLLIDAPPTCPDLARVGQLWEVAESKGIALANLLEQAQRRIDAELRHATATAASLQGPQSTAVVLALLPLAGIGMGTAMGANPVGFLTTQVLGNVLLTCGVALACGGYLWVQRMATKAAGWS